MPAKRIRKSDTSVVSAADVSPAKKTAKESPLDSAEGGSSSDIEKVSVESAMEATTAENLSSKLNENSYILTRTSEMDNSDAAEIVHKLKTVVEQMAQIKSQSEIGDVEKERMLQLRAQACLLITLMRRLNRYSQTRAKMLRENSSNAKESVDRKYLQLMNVQYEISHLKKEIQSCHNFKSKDEEIDLVPLEEFKANASCEIYDAEAVGDNPYLLKLAHLQYELSERKRLANEFKEAVRERAKLKSSIDQKKRTLTKLLPNVDEVVKASRPLESALGIETFFSEIHERVKHLPAPLFVLYCQATAYAEAFGKNSMIEVKVLGDPPENESSVDPTVILGEEDEKDESGGGSSNDQGSDESRKSRGAQSKGAETPSTLDTPPADVSMVNKSAKLLKEHPMTVSIEVGVKDRSEKMEMVFSFLICLNLVVVKPRLTTSPLNSLTTVLTNLFPKDDGTETPNPSNYYMFEKYGVASFIKFTRPVGFAYHWVQRISGVNFKKLKAGDAVKWEESVSAHSLGQVINMVQERVKSRIELARQVSSLEKKTVPLPPVCLEFYPVKLSSSILKFQPISSEEYRAGLKIDPSTFSEARENAMHFLAVVVKSYQNKEQLHAYIEVMQNYPNSRPIFNLRFSPVATDPLANWAAILRQLEEEANIKAIERCPVENKSDLITVQLYHLMCCFEVMTDSNRTSERVYPRQFKGRNRMKPFVYKPNTGLFLYN